MVREKIRRVEHKGRTEDSIMDDLLRAIEDIFKSFEYHAYIEHPSAQKDDYDLMMKPPWQNLKRQYDKHKEEQNG